MAPDETVKRFDVASIDDIDPNPASDGRVRLAVRTRFDIQSFGVNAFRADREGEVVREHTETSLGTGGQEELYVVLSGRAAFEIDGERVDAPAGKLVYVRDPEAKRGAVAEEDGTTVLVVGGTPGAAYEPMPPEFAEAFAAYNEADYEKALEKQRIVLEKRPGHVLALFNAACFEALLGRTDEAIAHLRLAVEADSRVIDNIREDKDLDSLRGDERFVELAGAPAAEPA